VEEAALESLELMVEFFVQAVVVGADYLIISRGFAWN
jgi:hypothetical protein